MTRATISNMLQRLERDGLIEVRPDKEDGRGKLAVMTMAGCSFMEEVLPAHYLRVTKLMEKITEDEQKELIRLLHKMAL